MIPTCYNHQSTFLSARTDLIFTLNLSKFICTFHQKSTSKIISAKCQMSDIEKQM